MAKSLQKPRLLFIHQHGYQLRYYRQLIAANANLFSGSLAYYWQPRLPSPASLNSEELKQITSFQRKKLQLRKKHQSFTDALLNLRAHYEVAAWLRYFKKTAPHVVVMWNGNNPGYRAATLAARRLNIDTRFLENGPLPNTTTCDPQGVNASSSIPRTALFFERYAQQASELEPFKPAIRKNPNLTQPAATAVLPDTYIFAPFQVHEDSQLLAHSPHIKDMHEFHQWLRRAAQSLPCPIVIKEHPSCKLQYTDLHTLDANVIFANHLSTKTLIERSTAVVTINSTVGLEAIFLGKPVVTLGNAFYDFEPLACRANTIGELIPPLLSAIEKNHSKSLCADGLRAWLENEYLVRGDWRDADSEHLIYMAKQLLP